MPTAMAIGAHPDDIEFMMAGTLILLGQAGWQLHYLNVANGSCGSSVMSATETVRVRRDEARQAARLIGAVHHPSLVRDLDILYDKPTLARLTAVLRGVRPDVLLVPSPEDYMEDHTMTARLAVSAAFFLGIKNYPTRPPTRPVRAEVTIYHAQPYGLRDGLRRRVRPGQYVNVGPVLATKRAMLACHRSQKEWLDVSQGLDSYLDTMEELSRETGRRSRRFRCAEGWRRHSHLGYSAKDRDPLKETLGAAAWVDPAYERGLL